MLSALSDHHRNRKSEQHLALYRWTDSIADSVINCLQAGVKHVNVIPQAMAWSRICIPQN